MNHRHLIEDLHLYFEQKKSKTHEEDMFLSHLKEELPYFAITYLHRDDLASRGFNAEEVDDCTMKEIAEKMGDAYQEDGYWVDLDIIAEDRVEKFKCPKCWSDASEYYDEHCNCSKCGHLWKVEEPTDNYVLVLSTETSFFETNEIGYESYESDDNGARYVPEHIYIAHFDKKPKKRSVYEAVCWPEAQACFDWQESNPKKYEQCEPISSTLDFDAMAIWGPQSLIK